MNGSGEHLQRFSYADCQKLLVKPADTIISVIKSIDQGKEKIALVEDSQKRIIGLVTDGDIRRALLAGKALTDSIDFCIHKEFVYLSEYSTSYEINSIMNGKKISHLPLLGPDMSLSCLFIRSSGSDDSTQDAAVVIMAGGKGR